MSYLKLSHLLKESSFVLTIFVSGFQKIATPELASQPKKKEKSKPFKPDLSLVMKELTNMMLEQNNSLMFLLFRPRDKY